MVNVSAVQLQQHDFVAVVESVLNNTSFAPELLKLEITEGVALQNLYKIVPKLTKLTDMVCALQSMILGWAIHR